MRQLLVGVLGVVALALCPNCGRKAASDAGPTPSASVQPSLSASAPGEQPTQPATEEALTGLDDCLVGHWMGTHVTMKVGATAAEGGGGIRLVVEPTGAAVLDFAKMKEVQATTPHLAFEFRYAGISTATLKTPKRGTVQSENTDYAKLRVNANAKLPTGKAIPILKNKPISEFATAASALSSRSAAGGAAPSTSADAATAQPPAIDATPLFTSTTYTCANSALTLFSADGVVTWSFVKTNPEPPANPASRPNRK